MNVRSCFDNEILGYWNTGAIGLEQMSDGFQCNKGRDAVHEGVFDGYIFCSFTLHFQVLNDG